MVSDLLSLNAYAYSGHSALMGKAKRKWHKWLDAGYVLAFLGKNIREAKRRYFSFVSVYELKISITELAKIFDQSPSTISYAVERGKIIAQKNNYRLILQ